MAITYGGDEVSAIVIDIGTHTTRAGYAGEETPRCVFPTSYGWMDVEVEEQTDGEGGEKAEGEADDAMDGGGSREAGSSTVRPSGGPDADADGDVAMSKHTEEPQSFPAVSITVSSSAPPPSDPTPTLISSTPNTPAQLPPPITVSAVPKAQNNGTVPDTGAKTERRYFMGEAGADIWRAGMEVGNFMLDGIVADPVPLSSHLAHTFHHALRLDPADHPLLMTEPAWAQPEPREVVAEIVFEGEGFPGFYSACGGVLSAFSAGKGTALVVDIGADLVSVTPISDGYAMKAGLKRQPLGMTFLNSQIKHHLQSNHPPGILTPHQLIKSRQAVHANQPPSFVTNEQRASKTTDSWRSYAEDKIVDGWREACCEVSPFPFEAAALSIKLHREYEFPNGYNAKYGLERYRLTELLFDPGFIDPSAPVPERLRSTPNSATSHALNSMVGLSTLIANSIRSIDVDHRPLLLSNIVLVGSGSLLPGLADRINADLSRVFPGSKVKIHAPGNTVERRWSGWLGGSILGSLGTFQQLWVARSEWDQHGPIILKQRCK